MPQFAGALLIADADSGQLLEKQGKVIRYEVAPDGARGPRAIQDSPSELMGSLGGSRQRLTRAALVLAHDVGIRRYVERENTITRWTDVDRGGHFAALEEPELLVGDLREFFRALR